MPNPPIIAPLFDEGGHVFNVKIPSLGAVGDGTTDDGPEFAALPAGGHYVVPAGTYKIGTATTIPADTTLELARGAVFRPASGVTLTIPGTFLCGRWLCFDLSLGGTVAFTTATRVDAIYPEWFRLAAEGNHTNAFTRSAALQATTRGVPIVLGPVQYDVDTVTLGANTALELTRGAVIRPSMSNTITIGGEFRCGPWFSLDRSSTAGSVAFAATTRVEAILPEWFRLPAEPDYTDAFMRAAAVQANTVGAPILLGPKSYDVGTVTLGANTALELTRGAVIRPALNTTFTIGGGFRSGPWFALDLSLGTVAFTTDTRVDFIRPEWLKPAGESSYTNAFTRSMNLQATTRGVPIKLRAVTYTGRFDIPTALYIPQRGGFILHGSGMRATGVVSDDATKPTIGWTATTASIDVDIRDLSVHTYTVGTSVPTTLNVIDLHGLRGTVDVPGDSVGARVRGSLRNVLVGGVDGKPAAAIRIRSPYGMRLDRIITESAQWSLKLEGGSNCTVVDLFLGNDSYSGIWVDEGGSHVFVRPRLEDTYRSTTGGGYASGIYLQNTGSNTVIGFGNEGKLIDYGIVLEGTKSGRPTVNNRFVGGSVTGTESSTATGVATILIKGNCVFNHFDMIFSRPQSTLSGTLRAVKFESGTIQAGETDAGATVYPRSNVVTGHFDIFDGGTAWQIDMGPDPASNIVDVVRGGDRQRRVFGSTVVLITPVSGRIDLNGYHEGLTVSNAGAAGTLSYYLPKAETGKHFTLVATAQAMTVRPVSGGTDQVRGTSAANKYVQIPAQGSATFVCVEDGFWEIEQSRGTLTFEP